MLDYNIKSQQLINDSREPTIENMQKCVGGLIQIISDSNLLKHGVQAAVNEEGLIHQLPPGLVFEYNHRPIPTVGNALFVQTPEEEGDTHNLTEAQIKAVEDYLGMQAIAPKTRRPPAEQDCFTSPRNNSSTTIQKLINKMLILSINDPLPEEFRRTPEQEGNQIVETYPRITTITWFANPQPTEIAEIQYNKLDIAFTEIDAVPFLCYRGTVLPWQEMSAHLSEQPQENHPTKRDLQELQQETDARLLITILLASYPQRIIKAMRVGTLSNQVSTAYLESLLRTHSQHTLNSYYAAINEIYQSYAANEIAELASHRCQLGD